VGRAVRAAADTAAVQPAHRPYERARTTSNTYYEFLLENAYLVFAAQIIMTQFLETFAEFPPRQKAASFTIDQAMERLEATLTSGH
jgi:hypothetical protein